MTIQTKATEGIARLEATAQEGIAKTREVVDHALLAARHKVETAATELRKATGVLGAKAQDLGAEAQGLALTTERYTRAHPTKVAAFAVAAGFFLAMAVRSARATRVRS